MSDRWNREKQSKDALHPPFSFLGLKKKILFFLSSDLAAETLSCTGCLPSVCRLCAPADKDGATGNHHSDVPNSLHRVIAEKTFRSWRAFKFCIYAVDTELYLCVCVFLISTWSKESLYSFVILWWSQVLINFALYYLCSAKVTTHELRSPFCTSAEWLIILPQDSYEKQVACDQSAE